MRFFNFPFSTQQSLLWLICHRWQQFSKKCLKRFMKKIVEGLKHFRDDLDHFSQVREMILYLEICLRLEKSLVCRKGYLEDAEEGLKRKENDLKIWKLNKLEKKEQSLSYAQEEAEEEKEADFIRRTSPFKRLKSALLSGICNHSTSSAISRSSSDSSSHLYRVFTVPLSNPSDSNDASFMETNEKPLSQSPPVLNSSTIMEQPSSKIGLVPVNSSSNLSSISIEKTSSVGVSSNTTEENQNDIKGDVHDDHNDKNVNSSFQQGKPLLDSDLHKRLLELKETLHRKFSTSTSLNSLSSSKYLLPVDLETLIRDSDQLEEVLKVLRLESLSEEWILAFCNHFILSENSFYRCCLLIRYSLFPKIRDLQQKASRMLLTSVLTCGKRHPKAIVYAFLLPLVADENMGTAQCEVINKVSKECLSEEMIILFLRFLLSPSNLESSTTIDFDTTSFLFSPTFSSECFPWTELTISIIENILAMKLTMLNTEILSALLLQFEEHVEEFSKSLKFSHMLFILVSKYAHLLTTANVDLLKHTLSKCDNYMAKACASKLGQLGISST